MYPNNCVKGNGCARERERRLNEKREDIDCVIIHSKTGLNSFTSKSHGSCNIPS